MLKPLIAGNWKMNGLKSSVEEAESLVAGVKQRSPNADILICPPATLIDRLARAFEGNGISVGGQDCHAKVSGAHTGDTSAEMLADMGSEYVIVGHSERRTDHGETNAAVKEKAEAALRAGITPIVCIGETLEQRESGATLDVLGDQLANSIPSDVAGEAFVVAYEPVWAIGTGLVPETSDIDAAHNFLRNKVQDLNVEMADKVRLLYGGSVKPSNAKEILSVAEVNGALVGGASLKATDFLGIIDGA